MGLAVGMILALGTILASGTIFASGTILARGGIRPIFFGQKMRLGCVGGKIWIQTFWKSRF